MFGKLSKLLFASTVGKKAVIAVTGLALFIFVVFHLLGNLTLLSGNPDIFNKYSHKLVSFGILLYVAEMILLLVFLFHVIFAIREKWINWRARSGRYAMVKSAGNASKKSFSSTTMIYTGIVILVFVIIHLKTFKFGPGMESGYITTVEGEEIRNLFRLVIEVFQNEVYVVGYVSVMILLGFHIRHGFWSAFQSLGLNNNRYSVILYTLALIIALLVAVGFLILPVWIYFIY